MYIYWPFDNDRSTHNFGDAINPLIGEFFSGDDVKNSNGINVGSSDVFLVCGSSLSFVKTPSIVWGSAILTPRFNLNITPKKIYAVRGPKTRKFLIDKGIKCPDIYGDPGLLCPLMFKTDKTHKYNIGIIPHVVDFKIIKSLKLSEDMLLIDIRNDFQKVIDDVNSCDNIISSSLHGLILADTYKIPSAWINVTGIPMSKGKTFKYHDYYESIGEKIYDPMNILCQDDINIRKIKSFCKLRTINLDLQKLIDACPFNKNGIKWEKI